jgi:hypothetical protein
VTLVVSVAVESHPSAALRGRCGGETLCSAVLVGLREFGPLTSSVPSGSRMQEAPLEELVAVGSPNEPSIRTSGRGMSFGVTTAVP